MAKTQLTVQDLPALGLDVPTASPTGDMFEADRVNGDKFTNNGKVYLLLYNDDATTPMVVTIAAKSASGPIADLVLTVGTATFMLAGPFPKALYNVSSGEDSGCVCFTTTGADDKTWVVPFT